MDLPELWRATHGQGHQCGTEHTRESVGGQSRLNTYTVGHTEIYAWGERVSRFGYGWIAVFVEPRIPWLQPWGVSRAGYNIIRNLPWLSLCKKINDSLQYMNHFDPYV